MKIAGVNHFSWILDIKYDGKDVQEDLRKAILEKAAAEKDEGTSKSRFNNTYASILWDIFGKCPAIIGHTKEYVPYWQNKGVLSDYPAPIAIFDIGERHKKHQEMWDNIDGFLSGSVTMEDLAKILRPDHATDIVEAMWSGKEQPFYVNTRNNGAVANLPDDAFLELLSDLDMNRGPVPRPVGEMPLGIRAMQMQVLDTHELTVEAIVRQDRNLLRRAMLTDPIVNSIPDAEAIINELMAAEREALPAGWFR